MNEIEMKRKYMKTKKPSLGKSSKTAKEEKINTNKEEEKTKKREDHQPIRPLNGNSLLPSLRTPKKTIGKREKK